MRKLFSILFSICFGIPLVAQKFEISLSESYLFTPSNTIFGKKQTQVYQDQLSVSTIRGALGTGFASSFQCKMNLTSMFGIGLKYTYFNGFTQTKELQKNDLFTYRSDFKTRQQLVQANISLKIPLQNIFVVGKMDLIIPLKSKTIQNIEDQKSDGLNTYLIDKEYTYNFSIGYQNALGIEFNVWKQFSIQTLFCSTIFSQTLKHSSITKYIENGVDVKNTLSTYQLETTFHDDINNFSNNSLYNQDFQSTKAKDELTENQLFNSLGLSFSLIYQFQKKEKLNKK